LSYGRVGETKLNGISGMGSPEEFCYRSATLATEVATMVPWREMQKQFPHLTVLPDCERYADVLRRSRMEAA
jgi:hypothetical protein